MMSFPFTLFRTESTAQYLYDANTSTVHPWNDPLDEALAQKVFDASNDDLERILFPQGGDLLFYIRLWRARTGAFRHGVRPLPKPFQEYKELPTKERTHIQNADLVLIVTHACNLRCAYCTYSTSYAGFRHHGTVMMTPETAHKAIDLLFSRNDPAIYRSFPGRNLNIAFYGGEPLLNFDVIREAVRYAREHKREHYGLIISIVTNLTLLKREHLSFLRDHDVSLMVSFDGPATEHDRYRLSENGTGTWDTVVSNLKSIREFDERYYFNNVKLQTTVNGNSDLPGLYAYFEAERGNLPPFQMINMLRDFPFSEFHKAIPFDRQRFDRGVRALIDLYVQHKLKGTVFHRGEFFYHFVDRGMNDLYQRLQSAGRHPARWLTGTCVPGRKIAVAPDGTIHLCERVNHHFPVGDVDRGLDWDAGLRVVNQYMEAAPRCDLCWAKNLCTVCYACVCNHDRFTSFEQQCDLIKTRAKSNLSLLYSILEKKPDAFSSSDPIINAATRMPCRCHNDECANV